AIAPRTVIATGTLAIALVGAILTLLFVRDTRAHVAHEQESRGGARPSTLRNPVLRACAQAGFVNNLNDALAWGLAPLYLAAHGASTAQIGAVAAVYPAVWGSLQIAAGWLSDRIGRQPLIAAGMAGQAGAL